MLVISLVSLSGGVLIGGFSFSEDDGGFGDDAWRRRVVQSQRRRQPLPEGRQAIWNESDQSHSTINFEHGEHYQVVAVWFV